MAAPVQTRALVSHVATMTIDQLHEVIQPEHLDLAFYSTINTLRILVAGFIHNIGISDVIHMDLTSLQNEIETMFVTIWVHYLASSETSNSEESLSPQNHPNTWNTWNVNGNVEWITDLEREEIDATFSDLRGIWNDRVSDGTPTSPEL